MSGAMSSRQARMAPAGRQKWVRGTVPRSVPLGGIEVLSVVLLAVLWEVVPRLLDVQWLPPLSKVVTALWAIAHEGVLWTSLASSVNVLIQGMTISLVGGILLGVAMGRSRWIEVALNAYVDVLLFTPSLVFAPILFALFGLGDASRVAVVVTYAMPIVIVNTMTAVKLVDPTLIQMASSFGLPRRKLTTRILLPSALPLTLEGVRLSLGRGIKGMVTGEVLIALAGLGGLASTYASQLANDRVWAITLVVLLMALLANWVLTRIESRLVGWMDTN